jgi:hypothetical protein
MRAANAIISFIVVETKRRICIEGIETCVLQSVGPHLVCEAEAAAFLSEVQNDTATKFFAGQSERELVAAIASP